MLNSQDQFDPNLPKYEDIEKLPSYEEATVTINLNSNTKPSTTNKWSQYNRDQANANFITEHNNQINNNLDMMIIVITLTITVTLLSWILWDLIQTWFSI